MDYLKLQLAELNEIAADIYNYVEQSAPSLTRRRLLVLQNLLFVDTNTNAVFKLLADKPQFLDGAEMVLRSIYDLSTTVDWILKSRKNERLWSWLRDDRKTLHRQLKSLVELKTANPKLNNKHDPLSDWQDALKRTEKELTDLSKKANTSITESELSLFFKVKSFNPKIQRLYHSMFWLFSTKTHASASGLQLLVTLDPLHLKRSIEPLSASEEEHSIMLLRTGLTWYAAHAYRTARYLGTPQLDRARQLYEAQVKTKLT